MSHVVRVGLLAEGEAELGASVPYVTPQEGGKPIPNDKEGALHHIIRRELIHHGVEQVVFIQRHPGFKRESAKGQVRVGHTVVEEKYVSQQAASWLFKNEIDLFVILVDADAEPHDKRKSDMEKAVAAAGKHFLDENEETLTGKAVGGLAIKTFDTWLLADDANLKAVLDVAIEIELTENLEELPTGSDSNSSKQRLAQIIEGSSVISDRDNQKYLKCYWLLAESIDLDQIKQRCPEGYGEFAKKLVEAVSI
ncbi:MAG: hypothetical protein ACI85U_002796 [Candidatus Promineifilaceae bacterium]|jgi:hypothetical protein